MLEGYAHPWYPDRLEFSYKQRALREAIKIWGFTKGRVSNGELRWWVNSGELQNIENSRFCGHNLEFQDFAGRILNFQDYDVKYIRYWKFNILPAKSWIFNILPAESWKLKIMLAKSCNSRFCRQNVEFSISYRHNFENSRFCRQNLEFEDYARRILNFQYFATHPN